MWREFSFQRQCQNIVQCMSLQWESSRSTSMETGPTEIPSPETTPHISASSCHSPEPSLWAPVLPLCILILGTLHRMCPPALAFEVCLGLCRECVLGVLWFQMVGTWTHTVGGNLPFPASTSPQSGHQPLCQLLFLSPLCESSLFHKHAFK